MSQHAASHAPASMDQRWRAHSGFVAWPTVFLMLAIVVGTVGIWTAVLAGALPIGWGCLIASVLAYASFTVMHEASHGNIDGGHHGLAWLEESLGWLSGLLLFAPYPVFRVLHLQHHAHTNDEHNDPDHWVAGSNPLSVIARCWTIMPHYYLDYFIGRSGRSEAGRRVRVPTTLGVVFMLAGLGTLVATGFGREALWLWVVPAWVASGFLAFAFDWLPHHPHALRERFRDTRILLLPGATAALLWQNYHLIHHLYPRIPFYRYGSCFREIRPFLEAQGAPIEGVGAEALTRPFGHDLSEKPDDPAAAPDGRAPVVVTRVERQTPDAVTLHLRRVDGNAIPFLAGQYLPLSVDIDGAEHRRCYSICTAPGEGPEVAVTVKRVPGGRVSNHLNDVATPGLELRAAAPTGRFVFDPADAPAHLVLLGGGSGMTPLLSMLRTALRDAPTTRVSLIVGNRDESAILFRRDLDELVHQHPDRLVVRHVLDTAGPAWTGGTGRLDPATLRAQFEALAITDAPDVRYAICGPAPMMEAARELLAEWGVEEARVGEERFVAAPNAKQHDIGKTHAVVFRIDGRERRIEVGEGQTFLEAAMAERVPVGWSCGAGNCGTCMMKLESGDADQPYADALLDGEREAGFILACTATPRSSCVVSQR